MPYAPRFHKKGDDAMGRMISIALAVLLLSAADSQSAGTDEIRTERVQFKKGTASAVVKGHLRGGSGVDYLVRAGAGQTLEVSFERSNASAGFNVLPPGSIDVAMHVAQAAEAFKAVLPADGDYRIRVYLVRAAARRNESSDYTLTVTVTGRPLAPLPASTDALIPGTPFHASAKIACVPYIEQFRGGRQQECDAFVVRRGFDGTATVEIPQDGSVPRRILFVKGTPVASDSPERLGITRTGDRTMVTLGQGE